ITANRTSQVNKTASYIEILGKTTTVTTSASNSLLVFDGWYEGNTKVHSEKDYPFTVAGPRTLEARYNIDGTTTPNIPDANFRNYIRNSLEIKVDETYTDAGVTYYATLTDAIKTQMAGVTQITMVYSGSNPQSLVSNTEGIQYFTGLTTLNMYGTGGSALQTYPSIDLSKNTNLTRIDIMYGSMTSVPKLPKAGKVRVLQIFANNISANTSSSRHDLTGVMDPSNGGSNSVWMGNQGNRTSSSSTNAKDFYFNMTSSEVSDSKWTSGLNGGPVGGTTSSNANANWFAYLWRP
ncbi:MAG: hypothetical protein ACRC9X_02490, partial [Bacteroidales bacterium]